MPSRIRFLADKFEFQLPGDDNAGAAVFEQRLVNGVPGLALKSGRIGNLTVNTIHLKNESVTVPALSQLGSDLAFSNIASNAELTFIEQNIVTKGVQGSLIFVEVLSQITALVTAVSRNDIFVSLSVRALLNDLETLALFTIQNRDGGGSQTSSNPQRIFMRSVVATGATQTINIKWRVRVGTSFTTDIVGFNINAGSRVFAVAMKR